MRFTIGKKLGSAIGVIVVLVTITTLLTDIRLLRMGELEDRIMDARYPAVLASAEITSNLYRAMSATRGYILLSADAAQAPALGEDSAKAWRGIDESVAKLKQLEREFTDQADKDRLASVVAGLGALRDVDGRIQGLARNNNTAQATELLSSQAAPYARSITDTLQELLQSQQTLASQEFGLARSAMATTTITIIAANILVVLIACAVGILLSRRFSSIMRELVKRTKTIAQGDLTGGALRVESHDEFADLATAVNQMAGNLRSMIESVAGTTERVASASEEISSSAAQQAQGADLQKDQAAQVASAMQEMATTVQRVSEDSNEAAESARRAAETAHHGGTIIEQTLLRMQSIAETVGNTASKVRALGGRSDEVGEIVGVIQEIAEQTNLLALNAAIEAARAGDQGRGFAVVADEVRKLAERTTKATREIAEKIKTIQAETRSAVEAMQGGMRQVDEGVNSTAESGRSLKEIISMVERVREMVMHIATASSQQSAATELVNANMDRIAKITHEAASGSQQSARACHELSKLALDLQALVRHFRLERGDDYYEQPPAHEPGRIAHAAAMG